MYLIKTAFLKMTFYSEKYERKKYLYYILPKLYIIHYIIQYFLRIMVRSNIYRNDILDDK